MSDTGTTVWFSRHKADVSVYVRIEDGDKVADGTIKMSREEREKLLELLIEARDYYSEEE